MKTINLYDFFTTEFNVMKLHLVRKNINSELSEQIKLCGTFKLDSSVAEYVVGVMNDRRINHFGMINLVKNKLKECLSNYGFLDKIIDIIINQFFDKYMSECVYSIVLKLDDITIMNLCVNSTEFENLNNFINKSIDEINTHIYGGFGIEPKDSDITVNILGVDITVNKSNNFNKTIFEIKPIILI